MSTPENAPATRLPDVLIGAFAVLLIAALLVFALFPRNRDAAYQQVQRAQLQMINQAMLAYAGENHGYYPGLDAQGHLVTNDVADRYDMLTDSGLIDTAMLHSPMDDDDAAYSYALLDIGEAGGRRDAWKADPLGGAVLMANRRALWSKSGGWVVWNEPMQAPTIVENLPQPVARTRYPGAPEVDEDDLFSANGPDDALLIDATP